MSAFANRYQIGDDCCGQVELQSRKASAIALAKAHRDHHNRTDDPQEVRVFDSLHPGGGRIVFVAEPHAEVYANKYWRR
jgi:hypothetical protein